MYEIQLKERLIGYSASVAKEGEQVKINISGMTSTEDGDLHLKYLNGFPAMILSSLNKDIQPCDIKNMVVLVSKDLKAKVYINEIEIHGQVHVKATNIERGQEVKKDDISGFERIQLKGIEFTEDQAYCCILSYGWDRIYIFDFSPLDDKFERKIEYDVEKLLGSCFSYLTFGTFHKIPPSVWNNILRQNWFPFYALKLSTVESLISHARNEWDIDELMEDIEHDTLLYIEERRQAWGNDQNLASFISFLDRAMARHKENDFLSSSLIIYPKIEALIRKSFITDHPDKEGRQQKALIEHITEKTTRSISALTTFIPDKFRRYLEDCYFKDFSVTCDTNPVSRHSIAHGASTIDKFDKKASLLGLLVFSQITEYIQQSSQWSNLPPTEVTSD
ncbi:hypothetical protein [Aeromonas veronii]|uniref:hypothetical protein n=1 Tax=Aeromonas veronii TaxID=654 RepID=UPI00040E2262|nr:hypothetical protein [Aeromonas veronii]QMS75883.1 hypothetical protein M001_017780 [Aeromonas veronii Hm21]